MGRESHAIYEPEGFTTEQIILVQKCACWQGCRVGVWVLESDVPPEPAGTVSLIVLGELRIQIHKQQLRKRSTRSEAALLWEKPLRSTSAARLVGFWAKCHARYPARTAKTADVDRLAKQGHAGVMTLVSPSRLSSQHERH